MQGCSLKIKKKTQFSIPNFCSEKFINNNSLNSGIHLWCWKKHQGHNSVENKQKNLNKDHSDKISTAVTWMMLGSSMTEWFHSLNTWYGEKPAL